MSASVGIAPEDRLRSVWRDKNGRLWRTVAVITKPAVVIEPENSGHPDFHQETHVLGSSAMIELFTELRPVES